MEWGRNLAVLSGQNLSCVKQDRALFENIDLCVNESEILYVRGQNGAGKTSLLRILVGLSDPASGQVLFDDQPIKVNAPNFHRELVYFGHKLGLNSDLNALENLAYWCQLNSVQTDQQQLYSLLATLGLVGLEDLPIRQLSAGQQRRVALGRLWLKTKARLWILDEPFTALDVQGIALLKNKLLSHLDSGGAVIITSHQQLDLPYKTQELMLEYRL